MDIRIFYIMNILVSKYLVLLPPKMITLHINIYDTYRMRKTLIAKYYDHNLHSY